MKELSLKDIQTVSLGILKEIDSFCKSKNIKYSVSGGTLLGAVRHKGFIPWDDDIDIMLSRKEYDRFCRDFSSDHLKLISMHNDKSCMIAFARVCDVKDTYVAHQAWTSEKVGVWVDVFPFDGAEDEYDAFFSRYLRLKKTRQSLYYNRALGAGVQEGNSGKLNFAIKAISFLHLGWVNRLIAQRRVRRIDRGAQTIPFGATEHVSQFAFLDHKEYYLTKIFESTVEMPFEDMTVPAIIGYDDYLTGLYGKYMELPPIEKQVPQQDYLKFYWKD